MPDDRARTSAFYDFAALEDDCDFSTRVIHDGESPHASAFPIFQANTVDGTYVRMRNPTVEALEEKMRRLEGGAASLAFGSGMAAVSHTLLGLLTAGDRMVVHRTIFVGVRSLLNDYIAKLGIEVASADLNSVQDLNRALERPTRLVYFETISNPALEVVDAPAVMATAQRAGALAVVDNTILTPFHFRPIEHGADVVIHSATKYLAGHGDALAGLATFRDPEIATRVHKSRRLLGGFLSPTSAFLVMRGMKTLPLRIARHCENAQRVAAFLAQDSRVRDVRYPGLPDSSERARATSFLTGFGPMVTFELCEPRRWETFSHRLGVCRPGMSFGDPATRVQREGPIRLCVGLEAADDILRDLDLALGS